MELGGRAQVQVGSDGMKQARLHTAPLCSPPAVWPNGEQGPVLYKKSVIISHVFP